MKEIEIPRGEYKFARVTMNQYVHVDGKVVCNVVKRFEKETKAIGELIADAGNTAQKCGLLPSELLRQRDTIYVLAMDFISEVIKGTGADRAGNYAIKIEAAIKSTEQ